MSDVVAPSILDDLAAVSPSVRLQQMGLMVDGVPFDLSQYPFWTNLYDIYNVSPEHQPKHICVKKCAQIGVTTSQILCVIDRAQWLYPRGILYLFPGRDEVTEFSKARFGRLITDNSALRKLVGDTETANLKKVGKTYVYFRGSRSLSQLEGIPIDAVYFDERDKMEDDMVNVALYRLRASALAHTTSISTPEFPEEGIDLQYAQSDQRVWFIKCESCGEYTCLELEWPDCLRRDAQGHVYRACRKCGRAIHVRNGRWVKRNPDSDLVGFWISQLCSPTVDPADILFEHETGFTRNGTRVDVGVFHRRTLGMAYAEENARLTDGQVLACCGKDTELGWHDGPTAMGVDVNQGAYHWAVGVNTSSTHQRVLAYGIAQSIDDILRIGERYGVRYGVIDAFPELNTVSAMCQVESRWWRCRYDETRLDALWDHRAKLVKVNRTQIHDQVQAAITEQCLQLPARTEKTKELVSACTAMYRTLTKDKITQEAKARWRTSGSRPDHYRHALAYLFIALSQTPVVARMDGQRHRYSGRTESPTLRVTGCV